MKGFPGWLNTRQDYLNMLPAYPTETNAALQTLLAAKDQWLNTGKLADGETGVTDDTHKVVEIRDQEGNVTERYQYEYKEDPNCRLFQLGFTVAEVQALLG